MQTISLFQVLETCVKNCGYRFHALVTTRDFIDGVLVKIISPKNNPPAIVQDKVLALIQVLHSVILLVHVPSTVHILVESLYCTSLKQH